MSIYNLRGSVHNLQNFDQCFLQHSLTDYCHISDNTCTKATNKTFLLILKL